MKIGCALYLFSILDRAFPYPSAKVLHSQAPFSVSFRFPSFPLNKFPQIPQILIYGSHCVRVIVSLARFDPKGFSLRSKKLFKINDVA